MFLAVDVGNSHLCFGVFDHANLKHHWRMRSRPFLTKDEMASFLMPLLDRAGLGEQIWEAVGYASVVPSLDRSVEAFVRSQWNQTPLRVRERATFPINTDYPEEVGADRIANAAYAIAHLKLPAVILDFGTAITVDVIGPEGTYEGGAILPGVGLAMESLGKRTAQLPIVDLSFPDHVIGKNTPDCIRAGLLYGYADLLKGQLNRVEQEIGALQDVVLTGGFSQLFVERLGRFVAHDPDVTLKGIAELLCAPTEYANVPSRPR